MNKKSFLLFVFILSVTLSAQNLIKDPDFDKPLPHPEIRVAVGASNMSKQSIFTEDLSWNKCLKLEVLANAINQKTKKPFHFQRLFIGGDKGRGVDVKADTVYAYSIDLKGNVTSRVFIEENDGRRKTELQTREIKDLSTENWKTVKGSFKTSPNAISICLCVDISADDARLLPSQGDYLLIDKVSLAETANVLEAFKGKTFSGSQTLPLRKTIAPNITVGGFVDYKKNTPAQAGSQLAVNTGDEAFHIKIKCFEPDMGKLKAAVSGDGNNKIWEDDSVEIFFAPVKKDRVFSQFVISAGGGRWMNFGNEFDRWKAKVDRQPDGWTVEAEIPYSLLGWDKRPEADAAIGFNVGRSRKVKPEFSAWNFSAGRFNKVSSFGLLFTSAPDIWFRLKKEKLLSAAEKLGDSEFAAKIKSWKNHQQYGKLFNENLNFYDELRFLKLKGMNFVLTKINPATTPTIPLLPENIANPPEKISARAAANEFKAVPLALTNLTDNAEEYRIVINAFAPSLREENGLKSDSGHFPMNHLKLYRGIRVRDKNGKDFGLRFDPLTPMDISQTVVVQPKEAVPIWAIFNTYGVKPGKYKGVVRVIPLCQEAKIYKAHKDKIPKMHDIPFEFEVLPFELDKKYTMIQTFYTLAFGNPKAFQQLIDFGSYSAWITPWAFRMSFNPDGSIAKRDISTVVKTVRLYKKMAEENGIEKELLIGVGLQAYKRFRDDIAKKQFKVGTPEWRKAWENFIVTADDVRKEAGLSNENYFIEVWDEPKAEDIDEALAATKVVHEVRPDMQIFLTLAPWLVPPEKFEPFIPYVRYWCFWSVKYFRPEYAQLIKKLRDRNKVLGFYTCETDMRQNLQKYYRGHAWTALAHNLAMANMYTYLDNLYYRKNWRQAPFGAFALMAGDTPLSTIRMECLRIGQNDLRYFKKLKDMFASTKIKDEKLRREIAEFLQATPQLLGIKEAFDMELAEATREKIIDYILKLQK